MSDNKYAAAFGPIQQFGTDKPAVDVKTLTDGKQVAEFVIRSNWQGQPLVKVSLWSEFHGSLPKLAKGVFVAIDGKYTSNVGQNGTTYHNLTAYALSILPSEPKAESGAAVVSNPVAQAAAPAGPSEGFVF